MAKIAEVPAIKLQPIIGDEGVRHSKSRNDILPHKILDINILNVSHCFGLCPLSEVINSYQYESSVASCSGERTEDVKPPLCKRPRAVDGI